MVYQLERPLSHVRVREGARQVPSAPMAALEPVAEPCLVWGADLCPGLRLQSTPRTVAWSFHNAGGARCQVMAVSTGVPWLLAEALGTTVEPDGLPVGLRLSLEPVSGLPPGELQTEVRVRFSWPGGEQELRRSFTLAVPQEPIAWFDEEPLRFTGYYPERWVTFTTEQPVKLYYGADLITECRPGRRLSLFPAEYRLEGKSGSAVLVEPDGERALPLELPCAFTVPGPRLRAHLRNLGSRPLYGRLFSSHPWLRVQPEVVELAPGESAALTVDLQDDGRTWHEAEGSLLLRSPSTGAALATLRVERAFTLPGPCPLVTRQPAQLPAVPPDGVSAAPVPVTNTGDRPLEVRSEFAARAVIIPPGATMEVPVAVGPPETRSPGRVEGHLRLQTNGPLPAWRYCQVPFRLDVVTVTLLTQELDFGTVRFHDQQRQIVQIRRSDHRRGRYVINFPPELQAVFRFTGDLLFMRNMQPQPVTVDEIYTVRDEALDGLVIGSVRIRGHCLVPRLGVSMPEVPLVPGQSATVPITIHDLGGGLELRSVLAAQPWAVPHRKADQVSVTIASERWERGEKRVVLTFTSNDFVNPVQEHELRVVFRPTPAMRIRDVIWMIVGPVWRPIQRLVRLLRSRR